MWKNPKEILPRNDYDFYVFVLFDNGHRTLSDGGTVNNDKGQIIGWMNIWEASKYLPKNMNNIFYKDD